MAIIKVLIPNEINNGYDYLGSGNIGDLVMAPVRNKPFLGLVIGEGDGNIAPDKLKPIISPVPYRIPQSAVRWIQKMSEWTMLPMGSIWKLMSSAADFDTKIRNQKSEVRNYFDTGAIQLNDEQQTAARSIKLDGFAVHLLDGITGSGKTQVYFDAAMRVYGAGKSVLMMMPEIALTAQFAGRFREKFGAEPVIWHSNLTPAKRRNIWRGVLAGDIKIVVGTRSALFLPWQDLGLLIIDEEHDSSYKQEEMGIYHARDMAILLAKIADFPVILASATPSFETINNVNLGKYSKSVLTCRFGGAKLPKIEIIDMRKKNNAGSENTSI